MWSTLLWAAEFRGGRSQQTLNTHCKHMRRHTPAGGFGFLFSDPLQSSGPSLPTGVSQHLLGPADGFKELSIIPSPSDLQFDVALCQLKDFSLYCCILPPMAATKEHSG